MWVNFFAHEQTWMITNPWYGSGWIARFQCTLFKTKTFCTQSASIFWLLPSNFFCPFLSKWCTICRKKKVLFQLRCNGPCHSRHLEKAGEKDYLHHTGVFWCPLSCPLSCPQEDLFTWNALTINIPQSGHFSNPSPSLWPNRSLHAVFQQVK